MAARTTTVSVGMCKAPWRKLDIITKGGQGGLDLNQCLAAGG